MYQEHRPHGHHLRRGRGSEPGRVYHVVTTTRDRRRLFTHLTAGRIVAEAMRYLDDGKATTTLTYVVMPDHVHWLFELGQIFPLSRVMESFKSHSARRLNAVTQMGGRSVWQRGYFEHAVREQEDIQEIARYIVANPLRAGLVTSLREYPFWDAIWL